MKKTLLFAFATILALSIYAQKGSEVMDNPVYARLGYAMPGGDLKSMEVITAGALFEVGTIFYLNSLNLPEKLKLGVDVTYLSISGFANMKMSNDENKTDSYFTAGVKLGPAVSYNFYGEWVGDLYFKIHPHQFITGEDENFGYHAPTQTKFGTSFGLNIRWKALMLGCEFTSAKYDFEIATAPSKSALETTEKSIKLPSTNLTLGVNF